MIAYTPGFTAYIAAGHPVTLLRKFDKNPAFMIALLIHPIQVQKTGMHSERIPAVHGERAIIMKESPLHKLPLVYERGAH